MTKSEQRAYAREVVTSRHPSIHHTGSVAGMKKLGYWGKCDVCVRIGDYIYNLSRTITSYSREV